MNFDEFIKKVPKIPTNEIEEKCDFVVCGPNSHFDDDEWSSCCKCGVMVCHRPYFPKKSKKLCMECMFKMEDIKKT